MHPENIRIACLGCKICCIDLNGHLHRIRGTARDCYGLGRSNFNLRVIPQNVVDRIRDIVGNDIVIERNNILTIIERERECFSSFIRNMT